MRRGRLQHGFYFLLASARADLEVAETAYRSGLYDEGDERVAKAKTAVGTLVQMVIEDHDA